MGILENKQVNILYTGTMFINILLGMKFKPVVGVLVALVSNQFDRTVPETHALGNARGIRMYGTLQ